jgi:N-acetylneuraminate synthase
MFTNPFLRPDGQPYLIAEFGSCHLGKLENIKRAVDECVFYGIDALKLQLFPDQEPYVPTNIHLPQEMFLRAFEYANGKGLTLTASVFDEESFQFLLRLNPIFIKLSYSKKHKEDWRHELYAAEISSLTSCDVMTDEDNLSSEFHLYCIPEYPVRYEVDFDMLFGTARTSEGALVSRGEPRFDGFSDHTLGTRQTKRAIAAGAKIIEKHVRLPETDIRSCPDARFAVTIEELGKVRG